MGKIATKVDLPELHLAARSQPDLMSLPSIPVTADLSTQRPMSPVEDEQEQPQTWEVVMDPRGGPASIPASCVSEIRTTASPNNMPSSGRPDLMSTGILSLHQALSLFDVYHLRLDHFLYRILGDHTSLDSVRMASPLLTAAVCTVGALHSRSLGHLFDICYREFKNIAAAQTFSANLNADDVRALCIGAFWLQEHSWALIGNG
jgi:hypothetical protein